MNLRGFALTAAVVNVLLLACAGGDANSVEHVTYTDATHGYSIAHPLGWSIDDTDPPSVVIFDPDDPVTRVQIMAFAAPLNLAVDELWVLAQGGLAAAPFEETSFTNVAEVPGALGLREKKAVWSATLSDHQVKGDLLVLAVGNSSFIITTTTREESYESSAPEFQSMLNSFRDSLGAKAGVFGTSTPADESPTEGPTATPTLTATLRPTPSAPAPTRTPVPPETVIVLRDENLEAAVRLALGKGPGEEIRAKDMEPLLELKLSRAKIANLTGIEHAVNLTAIDFRRNDISDISPLANLINLTNVDLASNDISDLSPLTSLTNLTNLSLSSNDIIDISPLANLTNLTNLSLGSNDLSDISPLASLTNLTNLDLGFNDIIDLSPLVSLTNLTNLDLEGNEITDISPLANLTNLTSLDVKAFLVAEVPRARNQPRNQITDISPLANLTNLTNLDLKGNQITDISPLANLTSLTWLDFKGNQITDISPLANLTNLTRLNLISNQIGDVSPLVENVGLGEGDKVWLQDNRLDLSEGSEDVANIRQLEGRGVVTVVTD